MVKLITHFRFALLSLVFVAASYNAKATHIMGSDISFKCLGDSTYQIIVTVYRDCSGVQPATAITVTVTSLCGTTSVLCDTVAALSGIEVSQLCPNAVSTCQGGTYPGVQLWTYVGTVTIHPNCGLYTFSYSDCCRNTSSNLFDPAPPSLGFSVRATLNSNLVNCDNAPNFTSLPVPYFCINQPVNYSHGSVDIDGDSLVYTLITPLDQALLPLTYQGVFTTTNPMPTAGGFNFDSTTGQMSFIPTTQGVYVVDVLVSEYRNGVLIGTTMRDIQIVIINCTNNPPNVVYCLTDSNVTGAVVNSCNSLGVCPGESVTFTITASDPDGQPVTVSSNILSSIPGATLTVDTVGNADSVRVVFNWTPTANDTGFRYFTIQFRDNACPTPGIQLFTYYITVLTGTYAGNDRYYCQNGGPIQVSVNGGTHFSWNPTTGIISSNPDSSVVEVAPAVTTTYIITSDLQGGCKNTDTLTVFVVPSFSDSITTPDDTICLNSSTTLTVWPYDSTQGPFTYSWTPIGAGIQNPTSQTTSVRPPATTVYHITITSAAGCTVRDSFTVFIQGIGPKVTVFPSANYVCPGDTVTLNALVSAVSCGGADTLNPCVPGSTFMLQDLGTGVTSGNFNITPYTGFYDDGRVQYLYRASELQALGLGAGAITDVGFNVALVGSTQPYGSFTIKMGCTSLAQMPLTYVTGLTQVLNPAPYTVTPGWNTHTLNVPYNWDGFSNLIIEVCYDNSTFSNYDNVYYSNTTYNSVLFENNDLPTTSGCDQLLTPTQSMTRPNTRFIMCKAPLTSYSFTWTGSNGTTLPDTSQPSLQLNGNVNYTLVVSDGTCSGDTSISLFVDTAVLISAGNDTSFCNNDTIQLNAALLHPAVPYCVQGYSVTSIPFGAIAPVGPTNPGPVGDDVVSVPSPMPFPFKFYCDSVNQFWISTNGFMSFSTIQGAGCCAGQLFPSNIDPNDVVALAWSDLNTTNGGTIDYFTNGIFPNRVFVVRFDTVHFFNGGGAVNGEIHLYETSNIIELHLDFLNDSLGAIITTGLENATGTSGITPVGYNAASYTVLSPVAFRFTPQYAGNAITNIQWTPSTGLSSDSILNPYAYPNTTTTYIVTATFQSGCVVHDTITVSVGNFIHSISASPDSICFGDTTQLMFNGAGVTYLWTPNINLSSNTVQNPFAWPSVSTTYQVNAVNAAGCNAHDTINIYVRTHAPITIGNDSSLCPYDSVTLSPTGSPYTSYQWSAGAITPSITTGSQTATTQDYWVRVKDGPCFYNSDTITIVEFILPPALVLPADTGFCIGDSVVLSASAGYVIYQWNTGANSQTITVAIAGDYYYLAIDSHGCVSNSIDTGHVTTGTHPVAAIISSDDTICQGQTTPIYVNPVTGVVYIWNPGAVVSDTLLISTAATYYLEANNSGCKSYDSVVIASTVPPVVDLGPDKSICSCDTSLVLSSSGATGHYVWSTADTTSTISVHQTGTYSLTVTDANNCAANDTVSIGINCLTVDAYARDANAYLDDSTSYSGGFTYYWYPYTNLDDSSAKSPHILSASGSTTYWLIVTDTVNGCVARDSVTIIIAGLQMPNAFTPNGDGVNDVFEPILLHGFEGILTIVQMRVYNRWSQLIYNGNGGWDGKFHGAVQPTGTYIYYIDVDGPDPQTAGVIKHYHYSGSFTLLH